MNRNHRESTGGPQVAPRRPTPTQAAQNMSAGAPRPEGTHTTTARTDGPTTAANGESSRNRLDVKLRRRLFDFPNPVNERAARVVAGGVLILALVTVITGWHWLILLLVAGFAARTAAGPRFSLLGRLATQVIAPRLGPPILTPGPPKRFAQAIGLVLTTAAAILSLGFGLHLAGTVLISILAVFAALESLAGFCAGCWIFGRLMRLGVIPESVCEACADVSRRHRG